MNTYAFIFARGGSKGLPQKNTRLLAGKPLVCHAINIAQQINIIDQVFVSTEDESIAELAMAEGATVILRPSELATDTCAEWLAWRHAIAYVIKEYGPFALFISLPPTSPLRNTKDIFNAIDKFKHGAADVCISVTKSQRNPYFNMVKTNQAGYSELVNQAEQNIYRRQDASIVFDITTVVYVSTPHYILNHDHLFAGRVVSIEIPKARAIDIDDIYDFKFAELLYDLSET